MSSLEICTDTFGWFEATCASFRYRDLICYARKKAPWCFLPEVIIFWQVRLGDLLACVWPTVVMYSPLEDSVGYWCYTGCPDGTHMYGKCGMFFTVLAWSCLMGTWQVVDSVNTVLLFPYLWSNFKILIVPIHVIGNGIGHGQQPANNQP